jgi:hypothetical protein
VSTAIINPENEEPHEEVENGKVMEYYYNWEIAQYVPQML